MDSQLPVAASPGLGRVREARGPNGRVWPPRSMRGRTPSAPGKGRGAL